MTEKPVAIPSQQSKHGLADSADVTTCRGGVPGDTVDYTCNSVDGPVSQLGRRPVALPSSPAPTVSELRELLAMLYDKWEEGTPCYEDPEDCTGFLGHAFKLTFEEENRVIAALGKRPVSSEKAEEVSKVEP